MECRICKKEFEQKHFNQRHCSLVCSNESKRRAKRKYKTTEKGIIAEEQWIKSERRKKNEYQYRQKPKARKLAVKRSKRWKDLHPEYKKMSDKIYGYRRRNYNAGKFDRQAWFNKLEEFNGRCAKCGTNERIEIDHIKPLCLGGTNNIDNLQPLCKSCNSRKNRFYEENL